ncbi:MAG: GNAT family N-acetyltransferase [Thaumarchaeota archaeon]|nr:GNAT family N-acetyltransferase [Nitrososphaerota archaeon]
MTKYNMFSEIAFGGPAMAGFKIRTAAQRDIGILVRQRHLMFEEMRHETAAQHKIGDDSSHEWATSMMEQGLFKCFLVTSERGRVAAGGCLWLREEQPGPGHPARRTPYLMSMYMEPKFRGKGLGSLIVKKAQRWSNKRGYPHMSLHASKMGRKLYAKLGWKRIWEMAIDLE